MFSVVVPVWNKRHTLRRTVELALAQTFEGIDLILIDDGSTDGSLGGLAGIDDPRLRSVSQANAGPGRARNRGIAEARHEWIAFLDGDDLWHPNHLAELDRIRLRHPDAALIGTAFVDSDRRGRFEWPEAREGAIERICYFDKIGRGEKAWFTSSAAARRAVLLDLGGFADFPRGEDTDLWVRIALAHPVVRSTRSTVVYRHGIGGVTETLLRPWPETLPENVGALSPAVGRALAAKVGADPSLCAAIDLFADRNVRWWVDGMAALGDAAAVGAIAHFHSKPAPLALRIKAAAACLPGRLGKLGLRAAIAAERMVRLISRAGRSSAKDRARGGLPPSPPEV